MPVPSALALTVIQDGALITAAPHRGNFASIQAAVNALIGFLDGESAGEGLVFDGTDWVGSGGAQKIAVAGLAPSANNGEVLTTVAGVPAWAAAAAGAELAYVQFVANVATTTATEAAPLTIVSTGSITYDGSAVLVEFFAPDWAMGGAANSAINLWQDGADLGRIASRTVVPSTASFPVCAARRLTPTAGAHTFDLRLWTAGGANSVVSGGAGGAGVMLPGFVRVTRA